MMVSVIIPYFNKTDTIDRSVASVINQTYKNWEIIIIDDCSELQLIQKEDWNDLPIRIIRNEQNLGPGPTRQRGMELAKGEYLAFLDADDWWAPEFLSISVSAHIANPEVAATWARSVTYWKDEKTTIRRYSDIPFKSIQKTILAYPRPWQTGSLVWKKQYIGHWGSLSTNQDYYFELSSSLNNDKVFPVNEVLYHVDQTRGNHRTDLVSKVRTVQNTFELFEFAYASIGKSLSMKYRIFLFHRVLRNLLKITELKDGDMNTFYWRKAEQMYPGLKLFFRSSFLLKVAHKGLQKTPWQLRF